MGGSVTGKIVQRGGTLTLRHAQVGGNVEIKSGDGFEIEATGIGGYLDILGVKAGTAKDSVCGSTIQGNMTVGNNTATIQVGGTGCADSFIFGNLDVGNNAGATVISGANVTSDFLIHNNAGKTQILNNQVAWSIIVQGNTGQTEVFGDIAGRKLDCTGNASITGGNNQASQKLNQCVAF